MSNLPAKVEPKFQLSDLWRWDGTIGRVPYLTWGLGLFGIKYGIDWLLAHFVFHRTWPVWGYFLPGQTLDVLAMSENDQKFFITMLVLSLPFIWTGVVLTMRRLRDAAMPVFLVKLFFIPFVNCILFFLLSVTPPQSEKAVVTGITDDGVLLPSAPQKPKSLVVSEESLAARDTMYAIGFTVPAAIGLSWLGLMVLQQYGWGLFVGIPFAVGMSSSFLAGRNQQRTLAECVGISGLAILLVGVAIFFFAMEGALCILMASPIVFAITFMGTLLGYNMQKKRYKQIERNIAMLGLLLIMPTLMGAEYAVRPVPPSIGVISKVEIDAPPQTVWKNVVAFPELSPPTEPIFKLGIAYPIGATISGAGPGAVRKCRFSTGAFIEPIKVWDEPRLLQFGVTAQPPSMRELSWMHEIQPAHLHGYLDVHAGQFKLIPVEGGGKTRTLLVGTTWYQNKMWPSSYWRLWSDGLIHSIHMRVLRHIKQHSELS